MADASEIYKTQFRNAHPLVAKFWHPKTYTCCGNIVTSLYPCHHLLSEGPVTARWCLQSQSNDPPSTAALAPFESLPPKIPTFELSLSLSPCLPLFISFFLMVCKCSIQNPSDCRPATQNTHQRPPESIPCPGPFLSHGA